MYTSRASRILEFSSLSAAEISALAKSASDDIYRHRKVIERHEKIARICARKGDYAAKEAAEVRIQLEHDRLTARLDDLACLQAVNRENDRQA